MKKSLLFFLALSSLTAINCQSASLESEIRSGEYCQSEVYKKFKIIEKTNHKRLKFSPNARLMEFVVSMELMCPWEVQRDLNGDKQMDWSGYVKIGDQYQLIAYLSNRRGYTLQEITTLTKKPNNNFVRWIQTKQLKDFTDKKLALGNSKYALQVVALDGLADIYLWDGKKLNKVLTTPQIF